VEGGENMLTLPSVTKKLRQISMGVDSMPEADDQSEELADAVP
jgi:hypothetical protein